MSEQLAEQIKSFKEKFVQAKKIDHRLKFQDLKLKLKFKSKYDISYTELIDELNEIEMKAKEI